MDPQAGKPALRLFDTFVSQSETHMSHGVSTETPKSRASMILSTHFARSGFEDDDEENDDDREGVKEDLAVLLRTARNTTQFQQDAKAKPQRGKVGCNGDVLPAP